MNKKTLVIMAHSNPSESKINKRIKESLENEDSIIFKDIKTLYSDYNFDIKKEQEDILKVDKIVFQFPVYWFTAPSILKQWVDDVFVNDFAFNYDDDGTFEALNLLGKKFQMIVSLGESEKTYKEIDVKIEDCLSSYSHTASLLGMKEEDTFMIYGVDSGEYTDLQLDEIINNVKNSILG